MSAKHVLLWAAVPALLLPILACIVAWAVASGPGPVRSLGAPVLPNRRVEIDIHPCDALSPGRLVVWYVDASSANRFIRERARLLIRAPIAPPCAE
jgi:hypothetical protein